MPEGSPVVPTRRRDARFPRSLATPLLVATALVGSVGLLVGSPGAPVDAQGVPSHSLAATTIDSADYDGDGLTDAQEVVLGTFPFFADTDEDGYGDGEEFARQSDPNDMNSVPESTSISAGITARGEDGVLKLVMVVYEPADQRHESMARLGALRAGQVVSVPLGRVFALADVFEVDGADGARIVTLEIPIDPGFVHATGRTTFFVAAGNELTLVYASAAKIDVTSADSVLLLQRSTSSPSESQSQGGGSIRQPIPADVGAEVPATWIPGSICFQRSAVIGGNGAIMLHQVVEADCLPGWDSYCASDCSSSVGGTFETIDPAALLGG